MAMAAVEPPLKKRRQQMESSSGDGFTRYDAAAGAGGAGAPAGGMRGGANAAVREEVAKVKRQNREEIRGVYRAYRAFKSCLGKHPVIGVEPDRELEKSYSALIKLATGCTSVRRIAAELIPRYAVFCPTALDAACRVTLQICEWTSSLLMQEQHHHQQQDLVISQTAEASFSGLLLLSAAATSAAASFPALCDMCAGVCRAVASCLLLHLNGNQLRLEDNPPKGISSRDGLINLTSAYMWKLFCQDPENVLASCFELLQCDDPKRRKHGQHFLSQILVENSKENPESGEEAAPRCHLISKIVHPKPELERWIVATVRTFRRVERPEIVEESLAALLTLIRSLQTFTPPDLEPPPPPPPPAEEESAEDRSTSRARKVSKSDDGEGRPRVARARGLSPEKEKEKEPRRRRNDGDLRRDRSFSKADDPAWAGWRRESKLHTERSERSERSGSGDGDGAGKSKEKKEATPPKENETGPMDVLMASEHLWVGSLDSSVTEAMVKAQFGEFGQLEDVAVFKDQGFALVQYKHLKEAVEARDRMQGSLIWGKAIRIKFLDADKGVPGSSHVWVGRISSQGAKEELLRDLTCGGLKPPLSVHTLVPSSALLLEFDGPEDANAVMVHIRQRRRGIRCGPELAVNRHLWVGRVDPLVPEDELLSAFSEYGELTGWKFIRQSGCCFIDFRSTDDAASARIRLNGTRFGSQTIVVEFKNIIHKNSNPSSPPRSAAAPPLSSPPGTSSAAATAAAAAAAVAASGKLSLAATLESLCSKFTLESVVKTRVSKFSGPREESNTLCISLPESVPASFMSESELRPVFNVACDGTGSVTRVRSGRIPRGPCRYVEFDGVEAAVTALQNIARHLDTGIHITFSNPIDHEVPRRKDRSRGEQDSRSPSTELEDGRGRPRPRLDGFEEYKRFEASGVSPRVASPSVGNRVLLPPQLDRIWSLSSMDPLSPSSGTPRRRAFSVHTPVTPAARIPPGFEPQAAPPPASPPPPLPVDTPPPPPPLEPPPPPPLSPPPLEPGTGSERSTSWRGSLCKSGLQYCEVMVHREDSSRGRYDGALHEPSGWPEKLDVTKRADFKSFKQTFNNCPVNQREVCRLVACQGESHRDGFVSFMDYLKQRDRAGVVKLPGGEGIWPRMLYILPWASEAATMLSVSPEPQNSLICAVLHDAHP